MIWTWHELDKFKKKWNFENIFNKLLMYLICKLPCEILRHREKGRECVILCTKSRIIKHNVTIEKSQHIKDGHTNMCALRIYLRLFVYTVHTHML